MRALTLRQPWPWCIALGDIPLVEGTNERRAAAGQCLIVPKRIENRDKRPPVAMVGKHFAIHAGLKVRMNGEMVETTTGRILLSEIVPEEIPYTIINQVMDKKALGELIDQAYRRLGNKATVILADRLRTLGYHHATRAGISICLDDMTIPPDKDRFISEANTPPTASRR